MLSFYMQKLPTFHRKSSGNDRRTKVKKIVKRFKFSGAWDKLQGNTYFHRL